VDTLPVARALAFRVAHCAASTVLGQDRLLELGALPACLSRFIEIRRALI